VGRLNSSVLRLVHTHAHLWSLPPWLSVDRDFIWLSEVRFTHALCSSQLRHFPISDSTYSCSTDSSRVDGWDRNNSINVRSDSICLRSSVISEHLQSVGYITRAHGCNHLRLLRLHFRHTEDFSSWFLSAMGSTIESTIPLCLSSFLSRISRLRLLVIVKWSVERSRFISVIEPRAHAFSQSTSTLSLWNTPLLQGLLL
jgi:hypothetical protein